MKSGRQPDISRDQYLDGQLLIAMPVMTDPRFQRSVIYMCAHSEDGAMGLIINRRTDEITFPDLLDQLDIADGPALSTAESIDEVAVHLGGPVETARGFVLHTKDYFVSDSTLNIKNEICLTATIDVLKAMAHGSGPDQAILTLGYAGWSPGQLEKEILANGWLNCPADAELVFSEDLDAKYDLALSRLGIDPSFLVMEAGHG